MRILTAADKVEIQILVDNVTDGLSSTPDNVETEFSFATRRGMRAFSGRCLCCAAHGLSILITVHNADRQHSILLDSGPEDYAFERNTTRLGADLGKVESIVLSHGHWDHSGAMLLALGAIRSRNGNRDVPFYAHPGMFRPRGIKSANIGVRQMDDVPSIEELTSRGAKVICTIDPQSFLDNMFFVSGEIPRVTTFERGMPGQVCRTTDGKSWEPDELLIDERWVAVNVKDKGLIVFSACSHAGVINVLRHARDSFPTIPLYAVMGGLHLAGANEEIIPDTVEALKEFQLTTIAAGHCTGWRAMSALTQAFGGAVVAPTAVGSRYIFQA
jgi:7,8-dihydropterin-6-yl-methyl-4-(beta-D-ribofuranosyl)aminobenzene 5'-phosphate synthase